MRMHMSPKIKMIEYNRPGILSKAFRKKVKALKKELEAYGQTYRPSGTEKKRNAKRSKKASS